MWCKFTKKEVLSLTRNGQYCGLWQIAQASNVLRRPIVSVYPTELHEGMQLEFNRTFYCIDNKYNDREPVVVMWTPMQVSKSSYPIHFIPLLKAVSEPVQQRYVNYTNFCFCIYVKFLVHFVYFQDY